MIFESPFLGAITLLTGLLWFARTFSLFKKVDLYFASNWGGQFTPDKKKLKKFVRILFIPLGLVAWCLLTYAMMRPQQIISQKNSEKEATDIYLVMDVSRSMLAEDFTPNRLEVTKNKIKQFILLKPSDRLGIILFSEKVFTLQPLTFDLQQILHAIDLINIGPLGSGTNIGDALALGIAKLNRSLAKEKILILFTDGVSQVDSITPYDAAVMAKKKNIRLYTIGLGSDQDAKLPIFHPIFGKSYQAIPGGSIDHQLLQKMAKVTGGKFYYAKNDQALSNILQEINQLVKSKLIAPQDRHYRDLFYPFLCWGVLILIVIELTQKFYLRELV